ncbi:MAG TPA: DUF3883 domain-containing protein [Solirubrobacterales bacterium]
MAVVRQILWRQVTDSDFVCVERSPENTPEGGGGQTYFSLSFGSYLDKTDFGRFLGLEPPTRIADERPSVPIKAEVLGDPLQREAIEFRPRYADPGDSRDRYYIARQNRQRANQIRHPAWMEERGFPVAPDDIADKADPRMPDLSQLKLIVARCDDGVYLADYVNADRMPDGAPSEMAVLFEPNRAVGPNGLIAFGDHELPPEWLAEIVYRAHRRPRGDRPTSPEIEDARDATARSAGARSRRGQGFRQSADERAAIDRYAMGRATTSLEADGWSVKDHSINHPYDLLCKRGKDILHVEVKGTTTDGAAVLLTPNEVEFARSAFPSMALLIVHGIELLTGGDQPLAKGGSIEFVSPWEIESDGKLKPTGFFYDREQ